MRTPPRLLPNATRLKPACMGEIGLDPGGHPKADCVLFVFTVAISPDRARLGERVYTGGVRNRKSCGRRGSLHVRAVDTVTGIRPPVHCCEISSAVLDVAHGAGCGVHTGRQSASLAAAEGIAIPVSELRRRHLRIFYRPSATDQETEVRDDCPAPRGGGGPPNPFFFGGRFGCLLGRPSVDCALGYIQVDLAAADRLKRQMFRSVIILGLRWPGLPAGANSPLVV